MTHFQIDGTHFAVPSRRVVSINRDPPGFVRIKDSVSPVEIVYHSSLQGKTDPHGAPVLFSINDGAYPRIVYGRTVGGALVVCRVALAAPVGGCASAVEFEGSVWTVLFPEGRVGEADAFRRRAEALLRTFADASERPDRQ
ncbi:hypothetical protein [Sphingosinicella sp. CPCC 101087]|uniref:hypothetical protein n=1 Tax=Sphingosinicella sp. CPCC 101087 TaxID=2497754 RepID=UPI00101C5CF8|nr:hypothetical protein [Sphingosinicella sp. CPCC 101087]